MGKPEQKAKNQARAAYLIRIGYPHGRRFSKGLDNIPVNEPGSAAYRRRIASRHSWRTRNNP